MQIGGLAILTRQNGMKKTKQEKNIPKTDNPKSLRLGTDLRLRPSEGETGVVYIEDGRSKVQRYRSTRKKQQGKEKKKKKKKRDKGEKKGQRALIPDQGNAKTKFAEGKKRVPGTDV